MSRTNFRKDILPYIERKTILEKLGFGSYDKYLESALWKKIRLQVLQKQNYKCSVCGERANQVHHCSYNENNLSGKNLNSLVAVCRDCHYLAEFDYDGRKKSLSDANDLIRPEIIKEIKSKKPNVFWGGSPSKYYGKKTYNESNPIKTKKKMKRQCLYCTNKGRKDTRICGKCMKEGKIK